MHEKEVQKEEQEEQEERRGTRGRGKDKGKDVSTRDGLPISSYMLIPWTVALASINGLKK